MRVLFIEDLPEGVPVPGSHADPVVLMSRRDWDAILELSQLIRTDHMEDARARDPVVGPLVDLWSSYPFHGEDKDQ